MMRSSPSVSAADRRLGIAVGIPVSS